MRIAIRPALAVLCFTLLTVSAAAPALAADFEQIEAIGAVPMPAGAESRTPPRDEAVREALLEAVRRSAAAILQVADESTLEAARESLGNDPFEFATQFQIVEDRGERPALFHADADIETEYVVVVAATVDRDRIRERLAASGLLAPSGGQFGSSARTRIALEGLDDYRAYEQIRRALVVDVGVRSATPVEASAGRIVLEVDSDRSADRLLADLRRAAPANLLLVPIAVERDLLRLRVEAGVPVDPGATGPAGPADAPGFDGNRPD